MGFEIGRKYRTTEENFFTTVGLIRKGQEFTCHHIDNDGDCWSMDVAFRGQFLTDGEGWSAATAGELERGQVELVS